MTRNYNKQQPTTTKNNPETFFGYKLPGLTYLDLQRLLHRQILVPHVLWNVGSKTAIILSCECLIYQSFTYKRSREWFQLIDRYLDLIFLRLITWAHALKGSPFFFVFFLHCRASTRHCRSTTGILMRKKLITAEIMLWKVLRELTLMTDGKLPWRRLVLKGLWMSWILVYSVVFTVTSNEITSKSAAAACSNSEPQEVLAKLFAFRPNLLATQAAGRLAMVHSEVLHARTSASAPLPFTKTATHFEHQNGFYSFNALLSSNIRLQELKLTLGLHQYSSLPWTIIFFEQCCTLITTVAVMKLC